MIVSRPEVLSTELMPYTVEERFIKLPVEKYLGLIEWELIPPTTALINAVQNPEYRFITAVLNRRTGKTWVSNIIGHLITLLPGAQILIIAPNYSLSSISWEIQRKLIGMFDIEVERSNAKDKVIELKNGSTIRMGSVSQVDSVVGRSYDLIIFDEAALNDDGEKAFNIQLRPTLDKPNSKAIFISTPRGKNWFHNFYMRGFDDAFPTWCSILSTWKDNPRVDLKDIEDARRTMSKAEFGQEYECDFISLQGQIFDLNADNIIDVDLSEIEVYDVLAGLDLGLRDPTALVVVVTDGHNFYVVDEYLQNGKTTSMYAAAIQEKIEDWKIDFIYIDSAAQQTKYDLAYDYDINTINAKKSVLDGIGYLGSIIDNDRLYIDRKCINTIECIHNYRWDSREGLIKERPLHDKYSHIADALRYAIYSHSQNIDTLGQ